MSVCIHLSVCMSVCYVHACTFLYDLPFLYFELCDNLLGVNHKEAICHEGCNANIRL